MDSHENASATAPVDRLVTPLQVWRKMTPEEYAAQHRGFGRHVAVSQEIVSGCQEMWVFLGPTIEFSEVNELLQPAACESDRPTTPMGASSPWTGQPGDGW